MGLFKRNKATSGLLLVSDRGIKRVETASFGMDLVQEVARLLGSEHIRSTKLGEELTLWYAEDGPGRARSGPPNPVVSRLVADHGAVPVTGPAVVTGPLLYGSPYPLSAEEITRVSGRLHG
ncbi:hypothetical protein E0L36_01015 [Streptomyces sp. AJS327]|uniref:hypothetical protein n=1 Tax=Streptomyces sp. AJS327 TaxID=2545265 RepID=UPI0015DE5047|nr:hypothetical protein [Streptomyces sp. AJS327]MBA0049539.1 hypothetical protein [Streptomyces sp. AJS327]